MASRAHASSLGRDGTPATPWLTPSALRERRQGLRLSQAALGAALGVAANTVARWERGELSIGNPELVRLGLERLAGDRPPPAHHLPVQLTTFIGREREAAEVRRLLVGDPQAPRLLTLTGAGGCGKTRLALKVAGNLLGAYPQGIWFVDLAPVAAEAPHLVSQTVATTLGVVEQPSRPLEETLCAHLAAMRCLLILDNCEHLIDACARLAETLLCACPALTILATSREPLDVAGERRWRVPSLSFPATGSRETPDVLAKHDAVRLFADRARLSHAGFAITNGNAVAVAEICQRLDGIPLALELAARWMGTLSAAHLATRLHDRFRLLTRGSRSALPRQQTLRATVDWSHHLLSQPQRELLRRLSVFAGGWTIEAAEAVGTDVGVAQEDVLPLLAQLVDKSLVVAGDAEGADALSSGVRYRLLETIRQYAAEKLAEAGEVEKARERHRDWYLALSERADPEVLGPRQAAWLDRLEREVDNCRAALRWSLDRSEAEPALRMGAALWNFWYVHGRNAEGERWLAEALALDAGAPPLARARALAAAGGLAGHRQDRDRTEAVCQQALALFRALGDRRGEAETLHHLGTAARACGDLAAADDYFEQSLAISRADGFQYGAAMALSGLGNQALRRRQYAQAAACFEESLALHRAIGETRRVARMLTRLGMLAQALGDHDLAVARCAEGLATFVSLGFQPGIGDCLETFAELALAAGRPERAVRLFASAERVRETTSPSVVSVAPEEHEQHVARARAALDASTFAAARAAGRAMSLDAAVTYALEAATGTTAGATANVALGSATALAPGAATAVVPGAPAAVAMKTDPRKGGAAVGQGEGLTPREREVAALVALGRSNRQIAVALVITERTAEKHVANILSKLAFASRAQVAAWAVERGLRAAPSEVAGTISAGVG